MSNIPDIFDTDMTTLIKDTYDLATAIRTRRKQLKMTQTYLASMMGVSRQLIGELEKGTPGVNVGLALDVCRELGLKLGYDVISDGQAACSVSRRRRSTCWPECWN